MRKAEQRLWDALRKVATELRREGNALWLERIENMVGDGIPDVRGASIVREFWIELKAPKEPARPGTALLGEKEGLRTSQKRWHERSTRFRPMQVYTLLRTDRGFVALMPASASASLNEMTKAEIERHSLAADLRSALRSAAGLPAEREDED